MSPSRTPTRAPICASASARFTDTVVLPTPPLPAPTAITFFTPGSGGWPLAGCEADRTLAVISTDASATPGSARTAATRLVANLGVRGTGGGRQLDAWPRRGRR